MSQLIVTQTNTLLAFGRAGAMSAILLAATARRRGRGHLPTPSADTPSLWRRAAIR